MVQSQRSNYARIEPTPQEVTPIGGIPSRLSVRNDSNGKNVAR